MGFFECVVAVTFFGVSGGVIMEFIKHRSRIAQLKLEARGQVAGAAAVEAVRQELRTEMQALRDTATQYDLSFDSALQRMERRIEGMERKIQEIEANRSVDLRAGH